MLKIIVGFVSLLYSVREVRSRDIDSIMKNLQLELPYYRYNNDCNNLYDEKRFIDEYIKKNIDDAFDNAYRVNNVFDMYTLDTFRKEVSQEIYQRCSYNKYEL